MIEVGAGESEGTITINYDGDTEIAELTAAANVFHDCLVEAAGLQDKNGSLIFKAKVESSGIGYDPDRNKPLPPAKNPEPLPPPPASRQSIRQCIHTLPDSTDWKVKVTLIGTEVASEPIRFEKWHVDFTNVQAERSRVQFTRCVRGALGLQNKAAAET